MGPCSLDTSMNINSLLITLSVLFLILPRVTKAQIEDLGNQIQGNTATTQDKHVLCVLFSGVEIECDPSEIRLKVRTTQSYFGRIYPKGLGKSACEKLYEGGGETGGNYSILFTLPLTSCNTLIHDIPTGLEYQNTVVIQTHPSLVTQNDRVYSLRCRYESMNTTITATLNMSDTIPAFQLEATAELPTVLMTIYKGTSESGVMADTVTIGDPIALVINLARQNTYGMVIRDCYVKDGVDMGGVQSLIDSKGCPVDATLFGNLVYSADLTQAYVIFRAHKFPYTDSLYYECSVKFCLKFGGDCQKLPSPPTCEKAKSRYRRDIARSPKSDNSTQAKVVAVVRGISVREPGEPISANDNGVMSYGDGTDTFTGGQWCVPRSAFAVILAVTAFLILLAVTVLVAVVLEKRRRRINQKGSVNDAYSSTYMSQFEDDRARTIR